MMDNGLYVNVFAEVQVVAELILTGFCLCRLAKPFMTEKKQKAWCVGAVYSLTMLVLYVIPCYLRRYMAFGIGIFAAFLAMYWIDRRKYEQKVFLLVTFFSLRGLAIASAEIVYDNLYSFSANTEYMARNMHLWFVLYVAMFTVYLMLEFLIMTVGIWCILKVYVYKSENMTKKELCMLVVPVFTGTGGYVIMGYYRSFYIMETGKNMQAYDVLSLLYYMISIIAVVLVIGLYQSIRTRQEEKLQNELLAAQVDSIRKHIGQVECLYRNIRGIRHDMTNHILTLEGLYAGNRMEEAREYSSDLKAALAAGAGEIKTGNPVTDVILQEWKNEAEKKEIRFQSDFYYPTGSDINAFDISVILNNALQNAVENVAQNAAVYIRSYHRNHAYMIEVKNSFSGSLLWDMETGLPVTSKGKTDGHGYGLSNIRRVAAKYAGDIGIDIKDGKFWLSVMLMMET